MFKRNLDSKCKVQNDSIKSRNMRNRKIAIDKQKIISIAMILTVISIFISYNVFFRNNDNARSSQNASSRKNRFR